MAAFSFFHEFGNHLGSGVHNFPAHTFKWALSNTLPVKASDTVLANITPITAANGYPAGGNAAAVTWAETAAGSGIWKLTPADLVYAAVGGPIGPFRYAILYNDTPTSPADPLIGFVDYGSSIAITADNTLTIDIGTGGVLTITVP